MHIFPAVHRSRVRLALTLVFTLIGLVVAIGAALSAWYVPSIITVLFASTGLPTLVDATTTLAVVSLVMACLGVLVAAIPLPARTASPAIQPLPALPAVPAIEHMDDAPVPLAQNPALPEPIIDAPFREFTPIPPISVYVDAENKSFSIPELEAFIRFVDKAIGNHHADRFFYIDVKQLADRVRAIYETGGFTLKNVPHKAQFGSVHEDSAQTKNAVDIAMALDILERALLGPQGQNIFLLTADRDYFPLLIRLKGLGHTATLWARSPGAKFTEWCTRLGVPVVDLDKEPSLSIEHTARKKRRH